MASAYGINLNAGATQAAAINDHVNASSLDGVQTWSIDAFSDSTISTTFAPSGTDVASSQELSAAVALWDCTASTLPKAHASADTLSVDDTYSVSGELLTRAQIALQAGAASCPTWTRRRCLRTCWPPIRLCSPPTPRPCAPPA